MPYYMYTTLIGEEFPPTLCSHTIHLIASKSFRFHTISSRYDTPKHERWIHQNSRREGSKMSSYQRRPTTVSEMSPWSCSYSLPSTAPKLIKEMGNFFLCLCTIRSIADLTSNIQSPSHVTSQYYYVKCARIDQDMCPLAKELINTCPNTK